VSGEGRKEEVQRQSGVADGAAQHQTSMAGPRDYHGLPADPPQLSADASLADDLNSFYAQFEASNNPVNGTVAEVSSNANCQSERGRCANVVY